VTHEEGAPRWTAVRPPVLGARDGGARALPLPRPVNVTGN